MPNYWNPINIPQDNQNQNPDPNPFQLFPTSEPTVATNNEQQQSEMTVLGPGQIGYLNITNQSPPQPHPQPPQLPTSEEIIASLRQQLAEADECKQRRDAEITELKNQLDIEKNEKQMALNTIEYNKTEIDSLNVKYQENQQKYENLMLDRDIEIESLQEEVMEIKSEVDRVKIDMRRQHEGLIDQVKIDMRRKNEDLCERIQDLENENNRLKIEKETYIELMQRCVRY